ncbi:MAG: antibiotic biosynthesis monooxygenase [Actinobacteria bacterium]|jgi:Uncharacterized protein conserved in bacteria|nr:antibiotic biosynthesis monooxygenase [Actinomycetota bacterium]
MSAPQDSGDVGRVTRIATRRALPGREAEYKAVVSDLFAAMATSPGFVGAELIPPPETGGEYQVVTHFAREEALAAWDASDHRERVLERLRTVGEGEPAYRRLTGLEAWFAPAVVPATMHPPRHRMALTTWLGIFPTVSLVMWLLGPLWTRLRLPFLLAVALNTALIVVLMTWVVMPRVTRWLRPFLTKPPA